jgi:hypothetical protein
MYVELCCFRLEYFRRYLLPGSIVSAQSSKNMAEVLADSVDISDAPESSTSEN